MRRAVVQVCALIFLLGGTVVSSQSRSSPQENSAVSITTPARETKRFALQIEDARPLANVADALQQKYGVPISYEDILWTNRGDLMPAGEFSSPNNKQLKNPDMLVPALARVAIDIDVDAKTLIPTVAPKTALEQLISQHEGRHNPGEFKVLSLADGAGFSIVPNRSRNAEGVVMNATSPLDARISIPTLGRSGTATIAAILSAVTGATGQQFLTFDTPFDSHNLDKQLIVGASDEIARDVLARTLRQAFDFKTYWRLFYGPEEKVWGLTIGPMYKEIITEKGTTEIRPVWWVAPF